jgi:hypothetical protein
MGSLFGPFFRRPAELLLGAVRSNGMVRLRKALVFAFVVAIALPASPCMLMPKGWGACRASATSTGEISKRQGEQRACCGTAENDRGGRTYTHRESSGPCTRVCCRPLNSPPLVSKTVAASPFAIAMGPAVGSTDNLLACGGPDEVPALVGPALRILLCQWRL